VIQSTTSREAQIVCVLHLTCGPISTTKPDVRLSCGHLLPSPGWATICSATVDPKLGAPEYRNKLVRTQVFLADFTNPKAEVHSYSQEPHPPSSPMKLKALFRCRMHLRQAADAPQWAASRVRSTCVLATDLHYYEGFLSIGFSTPWMVHFLDAHLQPTSGNGDSLASAEDTAHIRCCRAARTF